MAPPHGDYEEFVARFPYDETDDQAASIADGAGRSRLRQADGPAGVRRRRLRQDRGGAARGLRRRAGRLPGGGGGADHAAGAPALRHLPAALQGPAGARRAGLAPGQRQGARRRQGRHQGRHHRHRGRHARAARQVDRLQAPRPADRRRGAALRRRPQGAPEAAARGRARADPDGHADPAHPAAGLVRRARAVADHHAAGRPAGGAHLHLAVRSGHRARGAAARALPRRPELLRGAAHLRPGGRRRVPGRADARAEGGARPRPAGAEHARGRDDRLLRRQVRRAAVDGDRRVRPRHPQRQHADRASRRHVRPGPALSAARPRRPLQDARLRLFHHAQRREAHRTAPRSASRCCSRSTRWAPASRSPATTSTSAAPATCWARSSRATSARSASSSTSRCWRRRWRR